MGQPVHLMLLFLACSIPVKAQNVELVIDSIRSQQGHIVVAVFDTEENFKKDNPMMRERYTKSGMKDGEMTVNLTLLPGKYGIAVLDDENDDDYVTKNIIGYPQEGFGFSEYLHTGLSRPKFDEFAFYVRGNMRTIIYSTIKYL